MDNQHSANMVQDLTFRVGRFFDKRARQFDRIYREGPALERLLNRTLRRMIYERSSALLEVVRDLGGPTVLDVGCGSGVNSIAALEAGATRAYGLDLAPDMIAIANERAAESGLSDQCQFVLGDFLQWSSDERFDVVAALGVFDYVQDARAFLERMATYTRKSLVASFPGKGYRGTIRKLRYEARGCPLYLYDADSVGAWATELGLNPRIAKQDSSGFVLVASR